MADPTTEPDGSPRFCTACGAPLDPAHRFCGACGAPVAPASPGVAPASAEEGTRSLSRLTLLTIGFAMAALLVGALAVVLWARGDDDGPSTRTIVGAVTAIDEGYSGSVGEPCGVGAEDVRPQVTVVAGSDPGAGGVTVEASDGQIGQLFQCRFTFAVAGLPDAEVYQVSLVGGGARQLTRDELEAAGWRVELSIGSLGG